MIRKIAPILLINTGVVSAFVLIAVTKPNLTRVGAVLILLLFVFNFFYFRKLQRKQAQALAAGTAAPPSVRQRTVAMWSLAIYGVACYLSGISICQCLRPNTRSVLGWAGLSNYPSALCVYGLRGRFVSH